MDYGLVYVLLGNKLAGITAVVINTHIKRGISCLIWFYLCT